LKVRKENPNYSFGTNPCSEIILRDAEFCNLTEVVIRPDDKPESLRRKVRLATILGTWQATLTNFRYLSKEWKKNCDEEALLGVSLTGIMDNAYTNGIHYGINKKGLPKLLNELRELAVSTNKFHAKQLGINPSAAITCVKPSGTASTNCETVPDGFTQVIAAAGLIPSCLATFLFVSIAIFFK
jgi:ribonucleoside-diphosphate reductase alpha chain